MTNSKKLGGLGFRDLHRFNQAYYKIRYGKLCKDLKAICFDFLKQDISEKVICYRPIEDHNHHMVGIHSVLGVN